MGVVTGGAAFGDGEMDVPHIHHVASVGVAGETNLDGIVQQLLGKR